MNLQSIREGGVYVLGLRLDFIDAYRLIWELYFVFRGIGSDAFQAPALLVFFP